ncbi:MAG: hypothetical protein HYU66_13700 [Armatimonadetes bacterium]|nr:hypothetical protein [Armatimonadota bacterium]
MTEPPEELTEPDKAKGGPNLAPRPEPRDESARYRGPAPVIKPQVRTVAGQVTPFRWSEAPAAADVPAAPLSGRIAGFDFRYRYASVVPDDEDRLPTYLLRFSNKDRGELCAFSFEDDAVCLEWHLPTGVGEWQKRLTDPRPDGSYAWYTIRQSDGTPLTRNPDWAVYLRIDEERGSTESGGIASLVGRIALTFGDKEKSWLAGTFVADGCR